MYNTKKNYGGVDSKSVQIIEYINQFLGKSTAWLLVLMVLVQFVVVLFRYVYNVGEVWLTEALLYIHGVIIMCGSAYTLLIGGHVRIDIFFEKYSDKSKAKVEFYGSLFLLIPFSLVASYFIIPYVISSWRVLEGSTETLGIPLIYLLKTTMIVYSLSLFLQGVSSMIKTYHCAFSK